MKYDVELTYGIEFRITDVEADSRDEAIEKAKVLVEKTDITTAKSQVNAGALEYNQCSYIQESLSI